MAFFDSISALGNAIARQLASRNVDDRSFALLAAEHLADLELAQPLDLRRVADYLLGAESPRQSAWNFSDLPIVVYRGISFFIELLIWSRSSTQIHSHAFSGAFRVIQGGSLHTSYRFRGLRCVGAELKTGELDCASVERLRAGDVRVIESGPDGLIHALYHLESPSVTLVVRTNTQARHGVQYSYHPPGLALDEMTLSSDPLLISVERLLRLTESGNLGNARELVGDRIDGLSTAQVAYLSLKQPGWMGTDEELFALLATRSKRHCEEARIIADAVRQARVARAIIAAREAIDDPDLRFFLALLLNVPNRDSLLQTVSDVYPGACATELCAKWLLAWAATKADVKSRLARSLALWDSEAWRVGAKIGAVLEGLASQPNAEQLLAGVLQDSMDGAEVADTVESMALAALSRVPELAALFARSEPMPSVGHCRPLGLPEFRHSW